MKTNIHLINIEKYEYKKDFNYKNDDNDDIVYRTKIINYSFFLINEANICHKISTIPYYSNYFSILEEYEKLNVSQLDENTINRLHDLDKTYYLLKYDDKNSCDFLDFIYNSQSIKKLIFDLIQSFEHILTGISLLNANDICYFNQKYIFLKDYREKPVLSQFRFSLNTNKDKLNFHYISKIISKIDNFTYFSPEIHLLYYFCREKDAIQTVSYSFIEEFCEEFMDKFTVLRLFSDNYKMSYRKNCIEYLKKYINMSKERIIVDVLERNKKWDIYNVSIVFLHIFGCILRVFSLKGTFISKMVLELSKNIHPDSDKRMTVEETLVIFHKYLNEENWSYVNNLDNKKLTKLFDELAK